MTKEATHQDPFMINDDTFLNGTFPSVTLLAASDVLCIEFNAKKFLKVLVNYDKRIINHMRESANRRIAEYARLIKGIEDGKQKNHASGAFRGME